MRLLIYKYFPRFMVGLCQLKVEPDGRTRYRLLAGDVELRITHRTLLAETAFFNCFGKVLFPRIIKAYKPIPR